MKDNFEGIKKKHFLKAVVLFTIIVTGAALFLYVHDYNSNNAESYKESEKIINEFIAKQLKKDPNEPTEEDFNRLDTLSIHGLKITTLKPLVKLRNLHTLGLSLLHISDIKSLAELKNLKTLQLANVSLHDMRPPTWLIKIRRVFRMPIADISANKPIDISPLKKLSNLE